MPQRGHGFWHGFQRLQFFSLFTYTVLSRKQMSSELGQKGSCIYCLIKPGLETQSFLQLTHPILTISSLQIFHIHLITTPSKQKKRSCPPILLPSQEWENLMPPREHRQLLLGVTKVTYPLMETRVTFWHFFLASFTSLDSIIT